MNLLPGRAADVSQLLSSINIINPVMKVLKIKIPIPRQVYILITEGSATAGIKKPANKVI